MNIYHADIGGKRVKFRDAEFVVIAKPKLIYPPEAKYSIPVSCIDNTLETAQKILEQRLGFVMAREEKPYYLSHPRDVERILPETTQIYLKQTPSGVIQAKINKKSRELSYRLTVRDISLSGLDKDVQETYDALIQLPEIAEILFGLGQTPRLPVYSCDNYPEKGKTIVIEAGEIITPKSQSLVYIGGIFLSVGVPELVLSRHAGVNSRGFLVLGEIDKRSLFFRESEGHNEFYQRLRDIRLSYKRE